MQKILSWIVMFMFAGLAFTVFLYVASIIVPILFFVVLTGFLWIRYKQRKAVKLMFERNAGRERQHPVSYTHLTLPTIPPV